MNVLVVNAGSSSLKLRVLDDEQVVAARDVPSKGGAFDPGDLTAFLRGVHVDAVGHRVVHGGATFTEPALLDDDVVKQLRELTELAPLHQPKSLAGIDAVSAALPDVPAVACFDTAFHATLPAAASTYALPLEWRRRWDIRRYGFHGLSHAYAARRAAELVGRPVAELRTVVCHLGAGASLCAVAAGRSVDTTMGFTPLEGLVMATRSGSVDPGLVLWLQEHARISEAQVADTLEHRSGLLGLGGSGDMRELLVRAGGGDERARLAVDVYLHRLAGGVAAMAASLGGLDVLVFTAGVGENAAEIRRRAARKLAFLGVVVDEHRNAGASGDVEVSADRSRVRTLVVAAREDLEIARGVRERLCRGHAPNAGRARDRGR
ncbi:MAG: acetate/propionate family kinase [Kineosporiaceae bacterium]